MLDAARVSVRFFCPGCGAGLRAPRADAGSAIECHLCGEQVRVPRRPHPLECESDDTPLIPPPAAAAARAGSRLLVLSLALSVVEYVTAAAVVGGWAAADGPARVLAGDAGDLRPLILAAWVGHFTLVAARTAVRWRGYRRCEPAADAVRAAGWVAAARVAAVARPVGYALVCAPWVFGYPIQTTPPVLQALVNIGALVWGAGTALEFGALFAWSRILTEVSGRDAARLVARYMKTVLIAAVALAAGVCAVGVVVVAAMHPHGPPPAPPPEPPARVNFGAVPDEGWYAVGALLSVAAAFGAALGWQYYRILARAGAGLASVAADTEADRHDP